MIQELIKKAYLAGYAKGEKCNFIKPKAAKEHMANDYAEELVKLYNLHFASKRSELLFAFVEHIDKSRSVDNIDDVRDELEVFKSKL